MKKEGQTKRVIVTGCLAQRYSNDLAGMENPTLLPAPRKDNEDIPYIPLKIIPQLV